MTRSRSLFRAIRRDRTYIYRLIAFLMFVSLEVISVILLDNQVSEKLQFLQLLNAVVGTAIVATFVYEGIDLAKRNMNYTKSVEDKEVMQTKYVSTRELLFRIDNETREEVGAWLHGTLQPKLAKLAKDIRTQKNTDLELIALEIDEVSEKYVRSYSHDLYPPGLAVSLEVALETLLEGRAELVLDERLTNAADVGFSIWSPEIGISENNRTLRFHLGAEIAYAAYRIIEEAVANAERKPSTTRIIVDVRIDGDQVRLSIHDNGEPIAVNVKHGLGLSIIDAFMQKFDGTLTMNNVADGVEFLVLLPYQAETIAARMQKRFGGGA